MTFGALVLIATLLPDMARFVAPLDYLGDVSYGLYLWHLPVILTLKNLRPAATPATVLALTLAIVIALSATTWRFIEQPIIRRLSLRARSSVGKRDRVHRGPASSHAPRTW